MQNNVTASGRVKNTSLVNASGDPTQNLQDFELTDLQQFTREAVYSNNASKDFHLFYVGRDNVHEALKYVLSRASVSIYLNMFGFDDQELNDILMNKVMDPNVTMLITLDKSQATGAHEKAIIDADKQKNLAAFNTHFVIGQSMTHQISHTKGFVVDGKVGAEGSTNWSSSGEGTFSEGTWQTGGPGAPAGPVNPAPGYKAQNNTQSFFTDPDAVVRFQTELIAEHVVAQEQAASGSSSTSGTAHGTVPATGHKTVPGAKKTPAKSAKK
jgi:PLD-like domain